jgi:hypothetical protein
MRKHLSTQHKDSHHNDTQHNDSQHVDISNTKMLLAFVKVFNYNHVLVD